MADIAFHQLCPEALAALHEFQIFLHRPSAQWIELVPLQHPTHCLHQVLEMVIAHPVMQTAVQYQIPRTSLPSAMPPCSCAFSQFLSSPQLRFIVIQFPPFHFRYHILEKTGP